MPYQAPRNGFRTFVNVWATQSVSVLGSQLTFFATAIWLTQVLYPRPEQRPALAVALSAIGLAWALPAVFGAPLAGAWADRHDRKRTILNAHSQSIWQTQTPRELQGRVFAVRRLIAWVMIPISTVLAGWSGGVFNPGAVIAALGTFQALFCVAQLFNPSLLRVDDKEHLDQMAARAAGEAVP